MEQNMEIEVRNRLRQWRKRKWLGMSIIVLAIIYLIYVGIIKSSECYYLDSFTEDLLFIGILSAYALLVFLGSFVIYSGDVKIADILLKECDPFLYEACIIRGKGSLFKERYAVRIAMAQYYQGAEEKAYDTFRSINVKKLKGIDLANYYMILSGTCFEIGLGHEVTELEQDYRVLMKSNKKGKDYFKMLCANNNFKRAIENKDYDAAFQFFSERKELDGKITNQLLRIAYSMQEAQIYLGMGDKKSAVCNLRYVVEKGGRLFAVEKAKKLLSELEEQEGQKEQD